MNTTALLATISGLLAGLAIFAVLARLAAHRREREEFRRIKGLRAKWERVANGQATTSDRSHTRDTILR